MTTGAQNINQIYTANPTTTLADSMLMYLGISPYGTNNDSAALASDIKTYMKGLFNFAGNPNTHVAGALNDLTYDTTDGILWVCTTAGNAGSAVWTQVTPSLLSGNVIIPNALTFYRPIGTNDYTGTSYTLQPSDIGHVLPFTNSASISITIPTSGLPTGVEIEGYQQGTGVITFLHPGVDLNWLGAATPQTAGRYAAWKLKNLGSNGWNLSGNLQQ
jgi:hypothetical protein